MKKQKKLSRRIRGLLWRVGSFFHYLPRRQLIDHFLWIANRGTWTRTPSGQIFYQIKTSVRAIEGIPTKRLYQKLTYPCNCGGADNKCPDCRGTGIYKNLYYELQEFRIARVFGKHRFLILVGACEAVPDQRVSIFGRVEKKPFSIDRSYIGALMVTLLTMNYRLAVEFLLVKNHSLSPRSLAGMINYFFCELAEKLQLDTGEIMNRHEQYFHQQTIDDVPF